MSDAMWNLSGVYWDNKEGEAGEDGAGWRWLCLEDEQFYTVALVQVDEGDPAQEKNGRLVWKAPEVLTSLTLLMQLCDAMGLDSEKVPVLKQARQLLHFIQFGEIVSPEVLPEVYGQIAEMSHGIVYSVNGTVLDGRS